MTFLFILIHCSRLHGAPKSEIRVYVKDIKFDELLIHFRNVQERHRKSKQASKATELIERGMKAVDF